MSDESPPVRCNDESTWRHKGERIDLPRLLELIEENGGSGGLDLHGAGLSGLDAGPEVLRARLADYRSRHPADPWPPWLASRAYGAFSINLSGAHLENAHIRGAHLENGSLVGAHLENADLYRAHAESASLHGAHLENADLGGAHLQNADLISAHLENADLVKTHLENADLGDASLGGALWYGCNLHRTLIRRESLGLAIGDELIAYRAKTSLYYRQANEAYMLLKNNFNSIGRYEDAAWAYIKERQMEKMAYYQELRSCGWRVWRVPGVFSRWLRNWFYDLLTGYGERPTRPLLWAAALSILVFPLIFWAIGALPKHGRAFTSASPSDIDWAGWGDSIIFSLTTFGTLAFNRLQPDGALASVLAAFEASAGVLTFALFVFTLGNRMRRS